MGKRRDVGGGVVVPLPSRPRILRFGGDEDVPGCLGRRVVSCRDSIGKRVRDSRSRRPRDGCRAVFGLESIGETTASGIVVYSSVGGVSSARGVAKRRFRALFSNRLTMR